jgi:hypothetical protein
MGNLEDFAAGNDAFVKSFDAGSLPMPPARK